MPVKRWRTTRQNDDPQQSVSKGWHLIQNYRREDPERHIDEVDLTEIENDPSRPFEVPSLLRSEMRTFQEEVVGWLEFAMVSWFNFYFAVGEGSPEDRLIEASEGLSKTSERLGSIARQMRNLPWRETHWHDLIRVYAEAVENWATAIDLIGRGAEFDRNNLAEEGFSEMDLGSSAAERVVATHSSPEHGVDLDGALRQLQKLEPRGRVSKKATEKSREPWRRALVAAASRIDWSSSPW